MALQFQSTHPSGVRRRTMHCEPRRPYFNPHTPVGCDITHGTQPTRPCYFNPRTPVGCDHPPRMWLARHAISIHAPRERCDLDVAVVAAVAFEFQSTHPVRGCDRNPPSSVDRSSTFQSTHPVRGATAHHAIRFGGLIISIHAPREGCDPAFSTPSAHCNISIHAPREGCDLRPARKIRERHRFQSTHPMRGATDYQAIRLSKDAFQSTHPVRGATPCWCATVRPRIGFQSTHPVRGATSYTESTGTFNQFQSTHPVRGATAEVADRVLDPLISIHAPREGCDRHRSCLRRMRCRFQSTHPVRGATRTPRPRESTGPYFNPRTP